MSAPEYPNRDAIWPNEPPCSKVALAWMSIPAIAHRAQAGTNVRNGPQSLCEARPLVRSAIHVCYRNKRVIVVLSLIILLHGGADASAITRESNSEG